MARDLSVTPGTSDSTTRIEVPENSAPDRIIISDTQLLFTAKFRKVGGDLILTGEDGTKVVVAGYFNHDKRPDLAAPSGAFLSGDLVERLAGPENPGQYAQVGAPAGAAVIGRVERVGGSATVQHANGLVEELRIGDNILQGDIVETRDGSALGISFIDGTAFNMGAGARMSISELVYDVNSTSNKAVFSLVKGAITFVAGQAAKTGEMRVDTPVAAMGIRGTTVHTVSFEINGVPAVTFSLMQDPGGDIGSFTIIDRVSNQILARVTTTDGKFTITPSPAGVASVVQQGKSPTDVAQELAIAQALFPVFLANPANFNVPNVTPDQLQNIRSPNDTQGSSTPGTVTALLTTPDPSAPTTEAVVTTTTTTTTNGTTTTTITVPVPVPPPPPPVNEAPDVLVVTELAVDEDNSRLITQADLLANVTDIDGPFVIALNLAIASGAGHLVNNGDGTWTYNPAADDDTEVAFTFQVTDGIAPPVAATAVLHITPVNDAPVALDDAVSVAEDSFNNTIDVLGNDNAGPANENQNLTVIEASALHGLVTINGDGTLNYTPDTDYFGQDTISYTVTDNYDLPDAKLATAAVTVNVGIVNTPPVGNPDDYAVDEGGTLSIAADVGVLENDDDAETPNGLTATLVADVLHGALVFSADGSFEYTPHDDYYGPDSFTYRVNDGSLDGNIVTVNITVAAVNDAPVAVDETVADFAEDDGTYSISIASLLGNDSKGPLNESGQSLTTTTLLSVVGGMVN